MATLEGLPSATVDEYCSGENVILELGSTCLAYSRWSRRALMLPVPLARLFRTGGFRTVGQWRAALRHGLAAGPSGSNGEAALREAIEGQLLLGRADLVALLRRKPAVAPAARSIRSIGVLTCDRPVLLRVCVEGYTANLKRHGRELPIVVADDSADREVRRYVRPYPGPGHKYPISNAGGSQPLWARSGRELFYRNGNTLMAVSIDTRGGFVAGPPRALFTAPFDIGGVQATYAVDRDGHRFLAIEDDDDDALRPQIVVVPGWRTSCAPRCPDIRRG